MKTLKKNRFLLVLVLTVFALVSAILGLSTFGKKTAFAEDAASETFVMEDGVSAKLSNGGGIRFRVKMDETTGASVQSGESTLQIVIAPYYYFNKGVDFAIQNGQKIDVVKEKVYQENGAYYANGCITDIKEANRKLNLQAIAVISSGETVTKQTAVNANAKGNMYDVLTSAVLDANGDYEKTIFAMTAYNTWFGTETYPITVLNDAEYAALVAKLAGEEGFNGKFYEVKSGVTAYNAGDFTAVGGNVSKWDGVTLNLNGGSLSGELTEYKRGVGATLPEITKEGFTFGGWYDNAEFSGDAVTQISASDEGDKTFYAHWIAEASLTLTDKAQVSLYDNNDFTVDFGDTASEVEGDLASVTVDGVEFTSKTFANGKLTLDTQTLQDKVGLNTIIAKFVKTNSNGAVEKTTYVTFTADVATMFISTEAELNNFINVSKEFAQGSSWLGLFKLANDITCEGTYAANYVSGDGRGDIGTAVGFNGTFDGQGYTIYNFRPVGGGDLAGLTGQLGQHGTIKNVSFVNAEANGEGSILSVIAAGTIENVYVHVKSVVDNGKGWAYGTAIIANDAYGTAHFKNVIVEYANALPSTNVTGYPIYNYNRNYGVLDNVYAVGASKMYGTLTQWVGDVPDVTAAYADFAALKAASVTFENDFWTMVEGVPVPKQLVKNAGVSITNTVETIPTSQRTLTMTSNHPYMAYVLDEAALAAGLTVSGKVVTIPENATVSAFTVTAKSLLNAEVTASKTFYIVSSEVITKSLEVDMSENSDIEIDLSGRTISGNLTSATIDGAAIDLANVTYADDKLTVSNAAISEMWGEKAIVVIFEEKTNGVVTKLTQIEINALLVTKYIKEASDLTGDALLNATILKDGKRYGYFVQTQDITVSNERIGFGTWLGDNEMWGDYGFYGVYDGRGHVIDGVTQSGSNIGMFACLNGTVKNLVFTNATVNGYTGFIATELNGTVENVAVYGKMDGGIFWAPVSLLVSKNPGGTIKHCLVELQSCSNYADGYAGIVLGQNGGSGAISDCVAINLSEKAALSAVGNGDYTANNVKTFASYDALKASGSDYSAWDMGFWQEVDGIIFPKKLVEAAGASITNTVTALPSSQRTLNIESNHKYLIYSLDEAALAAGLTISGNVVTIPENATVSTFTVTATSMLNASITAEKTFYIVSSETIDLTDKKEVDMSATDDVTFDLSSYNISGELTSVKLGGTAIDLANVTFENGILTIPKAALGSLYGEKALVITFEQKSDGITTKLTTVNAEMLLVTKYIETLSDLQSLQTYAVATASSDTLGGYFVQTADISADGAKIQFGAINTTTWKVENRFGGVYDGRNHRIDSVYAELYGGIFTGISETGVVKNIVFTNAQLGNKSSGAGGNGGFISTHCYGTIENVVVHGAATYSTDKNLPTSMIASNAYAGSKITNCLVILTGHWGWNTDCYGGMIVGNKKDGATITNCLGINLKETDNESYAIPAIGAGAPLLNTSNDTDTVHTIHGWTGHNDTTENAVDVSYDNWVAACADTAIYNNGMWYIDTTTKKLVVNNTAANEIISGLQG